MNKWGVALIAAVCISIGMLFWFQRTEPPRITPVDEEVTKAIDETGDLLAADEFQVFSVNSKTESGKPILQTTEPISGINYTAEHTVITVFNSNDPKAFRGFYVRDKQSGSFLQYATPQMSPKCSYVSGDLMFLTAAEKTVQKGSEMTKVGIYQLKEHKWVKEWLVPGGVEDVMGQGKDVYFVTSNNTDTSSNLYKADLLTGEWGKMIQEARRYPLDQVALDTSGDIYIGTTQRVKSEWSNKIYRFNPQQVPYELTSNFVSNTRPFFFTMTALNGKMLVLRFDTSNKVVDMEKPLALLDLKSRKQMHLAWQHRPVDAVAVDGGFHVLGEDGMLAFVAPDVAEKPTREFQIPELTAGKWIAAKK
ncbi:hypothetical protein [Paenibacillus rigui]|uniref:Uncharacterized protein n=1 Tax=Paenibacillus rigui TaxID=554312 RepID=A0A229UKV4_9BACL|nr:hypothetical protein [Paenibacillus rigui]OXM84077.1 hypothetical protein CF651_21775 [Paenibacillus rigui]